LSPAAPPPAAAPALTRILAGESATAVLTAWCGARGLPPVEARVAPGPAKTPPAAVRSMLGASLRFRHVTLACGATTVSTADNWYAPGQLTVDMNRQLDTTDAPFGRVVKPLGFTRRTLATRSLDGGRTEVRAVLVTAAGAPFSYVVERYAAAVR
jgi:hypothetical protein